jgi:hypothetical protein
LLRDIGAFDSQYEERHDSNRFNAIAMTNPFDRQNVRRSRRCPLPVFTDGDTNACCVAMREAVQGERVHAKHAAFVKRDGTLRQLMVSIGTQRPQYVRLLDRTIECGLPDKRQVSDPRPHRTHAYNYVERCALD